MCKSSIKNISKFDPFTSFEVYKLLLVRDKEMEMNF